MQDDHVHDTPIEGERIRPEGCEADGNVLIEAAVEMQDRVAPRRSGVAHDDVAAKESPQNSDEILNLSGRDLRNAERIEHRPYTSAESQREPAIGQAMHGGRE